MEDSLSSREGRKKVGARHVVPLGGILVMSGETRNLNLGEAANHFLLTLSVGERDSSRQEVYKFVRWFGAEHTLVGLTEAGVVHYAESLSSSDAGYAKKLEQIRAFLTYVKKEGWSRINLASHLKVRKDKPGREPRLQSGRNPADAVLLTQQGYDGLEAELAALKDKRLGLTDEIRRAAADKDFRENVPLHAAREARGRLEGRVLELEKMLKSAAIIDENEKTVFRVSVGNSVILHNLDSGEERRYTLVSSREVDPARGKISSASPIGQVIIDREQGEVVEVVAPVGKLRYQIKRVER